MSRKNVCILSHQLSYQDDCRCLRRILFHLLQLHHSEEDAVDALLMLWRDFSIYSLSISSSVTNHLRQCRHRKCLLYQENFLKLTRNTLFTWRTQWNESEGIASGYVPPPSSSSSLSPPISASLSSPPSSALSSPSQSSPLELTSCSRSKQFSAWSSAFLNRKIIN